VTQPNPEDYTGVLVVEDEAPMREALAKYCSARGLEPVEVESGEEALELLKGGSIALMLLDLSLPGIGGMDVVPAALDADPDLAIVALSGQADASIATYCLQQGAYDYLIKPIEITDLQVAVDSALRRRYTRLQERGITTWLKTEVTRQADELREATQRFQDVTVATLKAMIAALEGKNEYMAGHSARVAAFAAGIASELELPEIEIERIRLAGWLHDLGKIGIRDAVLDKPGGLSDSDYAHIKRHPIIGATILHPLTDLRSVAEYVRSHHEHWDGSGYPDGLKGEEIPIGGRIICMAEVFEALTTERPYQKTLGPEAAAARMREIAGKVIDPNLMKAFQAVVERKQVLVFVGEEAGPRSSMEIPETKGPPGGT
jgi:putative two-component system response regulator